MLGGDIPLNRDALRVLPDDEARTYWIADVPADWLGLAQQTSIATQKWALGREAVIVVVDDPGSVSSPESSVTQRSWSVTHLAFGWPALSMRTRTHQVRNGTNIQSDCIDGWQLGHIIGRTSGTIPTGVHVPGFAINSLFYALILWGLFAAPFALRRRRRIKRSLCVKCAYPMGTNDVCTECGTPVHRAVQQLSDASARQRNTDAWGE